MDEPPSNYSEHKKPDMRSISHLIPPIWNTWKDKSHLYRKQVSGCQAASGRGIDEEGTQQTLWGDGNARNSFGIGKNVLYINFGSDYMVYISLSTLMEMYT